MNFFNLFFSTKTVTPIKKTILKDMDEEQLENLLLTFKKKLNKTQYKKRYIQIHNKKEFGKNHVNIVKGDTICNGKDDFYNEFIVSGFNKEEEYISVYAKLTGLDTRINFKDFKKEGWFKIPYSYRNIK